ncbi:protein phosphatase 2C domain-containing protein [Streptomyces sp. FXJ1.172]|uniref:protein phosphatase 2C domain-containing protein n=1 Tax=Streptomyces sp. FXJ1.172 TaxID=710705 RepID=UPI0007CFBE37|nr:protein phosphatase 2C domain-containing protein [Streptomyces sp. FXJ1.172]WEO94508.1 protein phosphatase 2C domain-containing protein [Streptomyces sp. FXJ1.172]
MNQQGGRPAGHEDDWWGQLYDDSTDDTGPTAAPDSLDDRFASAKTTVTGRPVPPPRRDPDHPDPDPAGHRDAGRGGGATGRDADERGRTAPWESGAAAASPPRRTPDPPSAPAPAPRRTPEPPPAPPPPAPLTLRLAPMPPEPPPAQPEFPPTAGPVEPAPAQPEFPPTAGPVEPVPVTPEASPPAAGPAEPPLPVSPPPPPPSAVDYVGSGPPTYDAEPTALPLAEPEGLGELVADTVLDGARYGACTLRAVSLRGDSARYRGEPRRDALLTARFGTGEQALVLVAVATGARATPGAHLAAAEACRWIGQAVGRSHLRLVADIRAARRGELKSGLHRLTDRSLGRLRASAAEQGADPQEYTASLRCLLLPADPDCRTRVFFGVGDGGLFRLRDGSWQDMEPDVTPDDATGDAVPGSGSGSRPATRRADTCEGDRLTMDLGIPTPPSPFEPAPSPPREPFRFRAPLARPGDALVMCSAGLADPLRGEPALCAYLARRWSGRRPPGLAAFLADAQVRVKGYADDRTAAAVWEA